MIEELVEPFVGEAQDEWADLEDAYREEVNGVDWGQLYPPDGFDLQWQKRAEETAAQALKRMGKIDAEVRGIELSAQAEIEAISRQRDKMVKALKRKREYLEGFVLAPLEAYLRERLKTQKRKSVDTLHGTLSLRTSSARLEVSDQQAAVAWAKTNLPEAVNVKVTETAIQRVMSDYMKEAGEVPEGCTYIPATEKFSISTLGKGTKEGDNGES